MHSTVVADERRGDEGRDRRTSRFRNDPVRRDPTTTAAAIRPLTALFRMLLALMLALQRSVVCVGIDVEGVRGGQLMKNGPTTPPRWLAGAAALVPLLWLPLSVLHPFDIDDVTRHGQDVRWLVVHGAMLALTPLLALAVLAVLGRTTGPAAIVGRVATVVWASMFAAFEAIAGIATGVLARLEEGAAAERLFRHGVVGGDFSVLGFVAHPVWGVAVVATAVALRSAGAPTLAWAATALSALFVIGHAGPLAVVAFAALAVGTWSALTSTFEPQSSRGLTEEPSEPVRG